MLLKIGNHYIGELSDEFDEDTAKAYYEQAMTFNCADAYFMRSQFDFNPADGYNCTNPEKVIEWLKTAAELGSDNAAMRLGLAYSGNMGILSVFTGDDTELARSYFQQIIDRGTYMAAEAQKQLNSLH